MVWQHKFNQFNINKMKNTTNIFEMSFDELRTAYNDMVAKSYEYLKAILFKREEGMMEAVRAYKEAMAKLGFSEEHPLSSRTSMSRPSPKLWKPPRTTR